MGRIPFVLLALSLARPRPMLLLWLIGLALAAVGVARLEIDTSTDNVLDQRGETWPRYQQSLETFGGDEILVVAIEGREPFDRRVLADIVALTGQLEALPGVRRVDSLESVQLVHVLPDGGLDLRPALADGVPADAAGLAALAERVFADRIAPQSLVSQDGRVFALNVLLESGHGADFERVVTAVREAVATRGAWVSGVPVFRTEINLRAGNQIALFVVLTVFVVGALLWGLFRSAVAVAIPLLVGGIGTWMTLCAMGLAAVPITLSTVILPSIMLALGCAYAMHLLTAAAGIRPEELQPTLVAVMRPTLLSALTTVIGFLGIAVIRIEAIQQVGLFGAIGVFSVLCAVLTLVPALLRLWPLPARASGLSQRILARLHPVLVDVAMRRRALVFAAFLAGLVCFGFGLRDVTLETDATRWFPRGSEVRESYEIIRAKLSGISPMNVVVEAPPGRSVLEPEALAAIDRLSRHLAQLPEVGKSISIADPLRQLHGGFQGAPEAPLPDSLALAEQYMLLLESLDRLADVVTPDRGAANILLRVDDNGSAHLLGLAEEVARWWQREGPAGYTAQATGIMYEFARAQDTIAMGQIQGLSLAFGAIAVILLAIYRSLPLTLIALIPNVLPVVVAFGFLGLVGVPLDAGTAIVGSLAFGIAVDDTIHLINAFHERRRSGLAPEPALDSALAQVLPALGYSTLVISIGFAVLAASDFTFTRNVGIFVSAVMGICFLGDALLLPALLLARGRSSRPD